MSRLWRDELRVGLCPDRLVAVQRSAGLRRTVRTRDILPVAGDPVAALRGLAASPQARDADLSVILSSHYVRHAVLPWTPTLGSQSEWLAYARAHLTQTYGALAAAWRLFVCETGYRKPRIACAVDADLMEGLLSLRSSAKAARLVSVQPYLISAFNARRGAFGRGAAWFILQEAGRLTLALIEQGAWRAIRTRQAGADWQTRLPDLLQREQSALGEAVPSARAFLWAEEAGDRPRALGYELSDFTLKPGVALEDRRYAMALH